MIDDIRDAISAGFLRATIRHTSSRSNQEEDGQIHVQQHGISIMICSFFMALAKLVAKIRTVTPPRRRTAAAAGCLVVRIYLYVWHYQSGEMECIEDLEGSKGKSKHL